MAATPSGKDKIQRWARIIYGGYDLSGDARTIGTLENEFDPADTTGWNESIINYLSSGILNVGITGFQCLMNDTTNRSLDNLKSASDSDRVSVLFGGGGEPAIPDPAYLLASIQMSSTVNFDGGVGVLQADFMSDSAQATANTGNPQGVILCNQGLTATVSLASHDYGDSPATTTNGWHANLHITATSSGDYSFAVEHSTNDSDWATLGTFTADGSAVTSEHLSDSDNPVNRYTRLTATRTAGTCTAVLVFARN
jgi:hypothetical protein